MNFFAYPFRKELFHKQCSLSENLKLNLHFVTRLIDLNFFKLGNRCMSFQTIFKIHQGSF